MIVKAYFSDKPEKIQYKVSRGYADIWLRDNIKQEESEDGIVWSADENYIHAKARSITEKYVEQNFDTLFATDFSEISGKEESLEKRVADLEAIVMELMFRGEYNE